MTKSAGLAARINRFIIGDSALPASVSIEMVEPDADLLKAHDDNHVSDFSQTDFLIPLLFLLTIMLLRLLFLFVVKNERLGTALVFILQFLMLGDLFHRLRRKPSGIRAAGLVKPYPNGWRTAFAYYLVALPVMYACIVTNVELYQWFRGRVAGGGAAATLFSADVVLPPWSQLVLLVASTSILAPVTEELWFRGIGLAGFLRATGSPLYAVLWTSLIFGPLHGPDKFLFTTVFGFVLALIRFRTGSLYTCVAVHCLHNTLDVFLPFLF